MKRRLLLPCMALCLLLAACAGPQAPQSSGSQTTAPPEQSSQSQTSSQPEVVKPLTEEDAAALFMAQNSGEEKQVLQTVLAKDNAYGLEAVVLYRDVEEQNSCNLAFLRDHMYQSISFAKNEIDGVQDFEPEPASLNYLGAGIISLEVRRLKSNTVLVYSIEYNFHLNNGAPITHFAVGAKEKK